MRLQPQRFVMLLAIGAALLLTGSATRADYTVPSKMAWWYDARFGMFIHFGSYSNLGHGEWAFASESYTKSNWQTQVSAPFNPTNFNATAIVNAAKAAGMKYIVITAKHHEGFAMWHSAVASFTDTTGAKRYNLYDYTNAGFHRDILMELKNACDAQGIKFCLYYSIMDWNHPSQNYSSTPNFTIMTSMTARANYITDMKAQLAELINTYHPAVLWFDGDWCGNPSSPTLTDWWVQSDATSLQSYLLSLKSDLIINERVKRGLGLGDFDCPEQTVPAAPLSRLWETNATMNGAWGYTTWAEGNYRSATTILHEMVQVMSRDGNYLLNIGPMGDGSMTSGSTTILSAFAPWMTTYGESVHGTSRSPFATEPSWGYYTKKSGKLYAHVFTWPGTQLQIPSLTNAINKIYLLNNPNTSLSYTTNSSGITVTLPGSAPNSMDSVVVVDVVGVPTAGAAGGGYSSNIANGNHSLTPQNATGSRLDANGWGTANGTKVQIWSGSTQTWAFTNRGSGIYQIAEAWSTGACLDVTGGGGSGANVEIWACSGSANQQWGAVSVSGNIYGFEPQNAKGTRMDVFGNSSVNGTQVDIYTSNNGNNQKWAVN